MLAGYLYYAYLQERVDGAGGHTAAFEKGEALESADPGTRPDQAAHSPLVSAAFVLAGLAGLVIGGGYFVDGSIALARSLGISETVIGLTVVAAGTSMPELATSAIAAIRKQADVALGNILGSNIYNILGIGGVTALISPTPIPPEIVAFDGWIMLGTAVILFGLMYTGRIVSRAEGAILFAGYLAYLWLVWPH
jgi:cation:H+ antiporter